MFSTSRSGFFWQLFVYAIYMERKSIKKNKCKSLLVEENSLFGIGIHAVCLMKEAKEANGLACYLF